MPRKKKSPAFSEVRETKRRREWRRESDHDRHDDPSFLLALKRQRERGRKEGTPRLMMTLIMREHETREKEDSSL